MKIAFVILSTLSAVLLVHGSALSSEYQWAAFKVNHFIIVLILTLGISCAPRKFFL